MISLTVSLILVLSLLISKRRLLHPFTRKVTVMSMITTGQFPFSILLPKFLINFCSTVLVVLSKLIISLVQGNLALEVVKILKWPLRLFLIIVLLMLIMGKRWQLSLLISKKLLILLIAKSYFANVMMLVCGVRFILYLKTIYRIANNALKLIIFTVSIN